jgi:hypothetical protein
MATRYDCTVEPGSDFVLTVTLQDSSGVAQDITGATVEMDFRETYDDPNTLMTATTTDYITVTGATGTITIDIPASVTALITQDGVYDILVTYLSTVKERVLEGDFIYAPRVTR